jgi:hypothetical protein
MNPQRSDGRRIIRASEVGSFSYCARAWWLGSVQGRRPDDVRRLQAGQAAHKRHGRHVLLSTILMRLAYLLLLLAGITGAAWLINLLVA